MVKVYCPPGKEAPLYAFMDALEPKLRSKLLWQPVSCGNLTSSTSLWRNTKCSMS